MTDEERSALLGISIIFGGLIFWANSDIDNHSNMRRRNRTLKTVPAREGPDDKVPAGIKEEKVSPPKYLANTFSTVSLSSGTDSKSNSRTSNETGKSIIPENGFSIRKYPSIYYTLNSKQQWKFRQKLSTTTCSV